MKNQQNPKVVVLVTMLHTVYVTKREDGSVKGIYRTPSEACAHGSRVTRDAEGRLVIPTEHTELARALELECATPELVAIWEAL